VLEKSNREAARCPRCAAREPNALGRASAEVWWFACSVCAYVWGVMGNAYILNGDSAAKAPGSHA